MKAFLLLAANVFILAAALVDLLMDDEEFASSQFEWFKNRKKEFGLDELTDEQLWVRIFRTGKATRIGVIAILITVAGLCAYGSTLF